MDHIKDSNHKIYTKENIEFRIKNVLDDLTPELVENTKIVMIDIDHLEVIERQIINRLDELGFSGIILLDDIHHPVPKCRDAMQKLWNSLDYKKYDVTKYGHWSGTGIVQFGNKFNIIFN